MPGASHCGPRGTTRPAHTPLATNTSSIGARSRRLKQQAGKMRKIHDDPQFSLKTRLAGPMRFAHPPARRVLIDEQRFCIDDRPFIIDENRSVIDEKSFLIYDERLHRDDGRLLIDEPGPLIDDEPRLIDAERQLIDARRQLIDARQR
jgi:hypothetical protein